jgi:hypothetical protein
VLNPFDILLVSCLIESIRQQSAAILLPWTSTVGFACCKSTAQSLVTSRAHRGWRGQCSRRWSFRLQTWPEGDGASCQSSMRSLTPRRSRGHREIAREAEARRRARRGGPKTEGRGGQGHSHRGVQCPEQCDDSSGSRVPTRACTIEDSVEGCGTRLSLYAVPATEEPRDAALRTSGLSQTAPKVPPQFCTLPTPNMSAPSEFERSIRGVVMQLPSSRPSDLTHESARRA